MPEGQDPGLSHDKGSVCVPAGHLQRLESSSATQGGLQGAVDELIRFAYRASSRRRRQVENMLITKQTTYNHWRWSSCIHVR